jgi:hypothetical protein
MLAKITKIDRYYLILLALLLALSGMVIFTAKSVFTGISTSREVDSQLLEASLPRLDKGNLDKAYDFVSNQSRSALDLK